MVPGSSTSFRHSSPIGNVSLPMPDMSISTIQQLTDEMCSVNRDQEAIISINSDTATSNKLVNYSMSSSSSTKSQHVDTALAATDAGLAARDDDVRVVPDHDPAGVQDNESDATIRAKEVPSTSIRRPRRKTPEELNQRQESTEAQKRRVEVIPPPPSPPFRYQPRSVLPDLDAPSRPSKRRKINVDQDIPGPSKLTTNSTTNSFKIKNLSRGGLANEGSSCCLNAIIFSLHLSQCTLGKFCQSTLGNFPSVHWLT